MNNFYASVEISNNILNQLVIKYFKLMKNEKEKQKAIKIWSYWTKY